MKLVFADRGWEDFCFWIDHDRKIAKRLIRLIDECGKTPSEGTGKPRAAARKPQRLLVPPHHRRASPGVQDRRRRTLHRASALSLLSPTAKSVARARLRRSGEE